MVQQVCVLGRSLYHSCSMPHILSKTESISHSSIESILQVIKTKPPTGLVFLVRNELEVDVL